MARSERKQFRDEIKAPDQFENFWDSVGGWFAEHKQKIILLAVVVVLAVAGITYKKALDKKRHTVAMDAFIELQDDLKSIDEPNKKVERIDQYINKYKNTPIVAMAYMYSGIEQMNLGQEQEAQKAFELAKEKLPHNQKIFALESLAQLASKQEKLGEAQKYYQDILRMKEVPLQDYYAWNLIVLYKQDNKLEDLNSLCENFSQRYPESAFLDKVKIYCAQ
ncbi:tetratricopeptide repeat protein [bacterium]|nr:tetratricopeptide repeat protein [bacterium]